MVIRAHSRLFQSGSGEVKVWMGHRVKQSSKVDADEGGKLLLNLLDCFGDTRNPRFP